MLDIDVIGAGGGNYLPGYPVCLGSSSLAKSHAGFWPGTLRRDGRGRGSAVAILRGAHRPNGNGKGGE